MNPPILNPAIAGSYADSVKLAGCAPTYMKYIGCDPTEQSYPLLSYRSRVTGDNLGPGFPAAGLVAQRQEVRGTLRHPVGLSGPSKDEGAKINGGVTS